MATNLRVFASMILLIAVLASVVTIPVTEEAKCKADAGIMVNGDTVLLLYDTGLVRWPRVVAWRLGPVVYGRLEGCAYG